MISREYLFSSMVIVDEVFMVVIVMVFSDTLDHFRFCISEKRKDVKQQKQKKSRTICKSVVFPIFFSYVRPL